MLYCVQSGSQYGAGSLPSDCDEGQKGASCPPQSQDPSKRLENFTVQNGCSTDQRNGTRQVAVASCASPRLGIEDRAFWSPLPLMGLGRMRKWGCRRGGNKRAQLANLATFSWLIKVFVEGNNEVLLGGSCQMQCVASKQRKNIQMKPFAMEILIKFSSWQQTTSHAKITGDMLLHMKLQGQTGHR
jgi:hypothetical protein